MTEHTPPLDKLRKLHEAATAGRWTYGQNGFVESNGEVLFVFWGRMEEEFDNAQSNGRFAAAAHNLLPAVLDRLEQAERERDAILADRDRWRDVAETEHLYTKTEEARADQAEAEREHAVSALRQMLATREKDIDLLNRMYDRLHDEYAALKEAADLTERIQRLADAIAALAAAQETP